MPAEPPALVVVLVVVWTFEVVGAEDPPSPPLLPLPEVTKVTIE